jgi:hypothetical protein
VYQCTGVSKRQSTFAIDSFCCSLLNRIGINLPTITINNNRNNKLQLQLLLLLTDLDFFFFFLPLSTLFPARNNVCLAADNASSRLGQPTCSGSQTTHKQFVKDQYNNRFETTNLAMNDEFDVADGQTTLSEKRVVFFPFRQHIALKQR